MLQESFSCLHTTTGQEWLQKKQEPPCCSYLHFHAIEAHPVSRRERARSQEVRAQNWESCTADSGRTICSPAPGHVVYRQLEVPPKTRKSSPCTQSKTKAALSGMSTRPSRYSMSFPCPTMGILVLPFGTFHSFCLVANLSIQLSCPVSTNPESPGSMLLQILSTLQHLL